MPGTPEQKRRYSVLLAPIQDITYQTKGNKNKEKRTYGRKERKVE
jgi:hypothetical protein